MATTTPAVEVKEIDVIGDRIADGLKYAKKVVETITVTGVPSEFGFVQTLNGAEYVVDLITGVVTVKMGPNYQLVANITTGQLTVFRGQTWMSFLDELHTKYVAGKKKDSLKNPSHYKYLKYIGL